MSDDHLRPGEPAPLDVLPREIVPPSHLEDRVVQGLRNRGAFRARAASRFPLMAAAAAVLVLAFGAGVWIGRGGPAGVAPPPGDRYLLLLYGASTSTPDEEAARTAEYEAWARTEAAGGHLESGERLEDQAVVLGADEGLGAPPLGFFIVRSSSQAEAESVARRCPHLRHGGTVVVRPIATTD